MKIECELCHATAEMADMAPRAGGGMDVKCGVCGRWFAAKPAAGAPVPAPVEPSVRVAPKPSGPACPKCGRVRGAGEACTRCGLVFANWTGPAAADASLDAQAEALWLEAEAAWTDQSRHDAFMAYCQKVGLLGPAGRRYRERLDREPGEPTAKRMQDKILGLAAHLLGPHSTAHEPITRSKWFFALIVALAIAGALAGMAFKH